MFEIQKSIFIQKYFVCFHDLLVDFSKYLLDYSNSCDKCSEITHWTFEYHDFLNLLFNLMALL